MASDRDLETRTVVQLLDMIDRDTVTALGTVQALVAATLFPDHALASVELDLLQIAVAVDRAQQLLHHSVQVLSGLRLPGDGQDMVA